MRTFAETVAKAKRDRLDTLLVQFYICEKNARGLMEMIAETVAQEEGTC